jgi:hypothetical protein
MTEAYLKREMEQQEFLEGLERECSHDSDGDYLPDSTILHQAELLINEILYELKTSKSSWDIGTGGDLNGTTLLIKQIDEFARTPEEAMVLKRRLLEKMIQYGFHDAEAAYLRQRVHQAKKLYNGHEAMDEVEF